jgi:hypothetical protein
MNLRTRIVAGASAGAMVSLLGVAATPAIADSSPTSALGSVSSPAHRAEFPLTVTRTGGIAGFQDVLVVAADGLLSVTLKGQQQPQRQLTPDAVNRLTTAAFQVPWPRITPASGQPAFPDDMVSMVLSPLGGPARLEDPMVGAAGQVFQELLNDLSAGTTASGAIVGTSMISR